MNHLLLLVAVVSFAIIELMLATTANGQNQGNSTEKPQNGSDATALPQICKHPTDGRVVSPGERYSIIGDCFVYICMDDGLGIGVLGCPEFVPEEGCRKSSIDNTKLYPLCCPQHVCDKKAGKQ